MRKMRGLAVPALFAAAFLAGCGKEPVYEISAGEESASSRQETEGSLRESEEAYESQAPEQLYVYVCGAVNSPGVYRFAPETRVYEAVDQAGGFAPDADQEWLNQAELVTDGQKLYIYTEAETRQMEEAGQTAWLTEAPGGGEETEQEKVNLNTADRELLMTLPGIGEAKADAIVQYRTENGPFSAVEDILQVSGIKDAVFSKIKDQITV